MEALQRLSTILKEKSMTVEHQHKENNKHPQIQLRWSCYTKHLVHMEDLQKITKPGKLPAINPLARTEKEPLQAGLYGKGRLEHKISKDNSTRPFRIWGTWEPQIIYKKGYQQLQLLIGHIRNEDTQEEMIWHKVEFLQLLAGIRDPIMSSKINN